MLKVTFLCFLFVASGYSENHIIYNPVVTSWGDWGSWDECTSGHFAIGFQLKTESKQGGGDDTALNGIMLMCGKPGSRNTDKYIKSLEGKWGNWGDLLYCDGLLTGFQLRSEAALGSGVDDTAANNMNGFCTKADGQVTKLPGDGLDWGYWTAEQHCNTGYAVCGIRTQVEPHVGDEDDTALNNIQLKCCNYLDALTSCTPSDNWKQISICDNRESSSTMHCSYSETIGVSTTTGSSSSQSDSETYSEQTTTSFGVEFGDVVGKLSQKFETQLGTSQTTAHEWSSESSQTWNRATTHEVKFAVPPNSGSKLLQVIGSCGNFKIHTAHFKKVDL